MENETANFYANAVNAATSIWDVTLQFRTQSLVGPIEADKPPVIETSGICNVRMSPQHAKALVALLAIQIIEYENQFKVNLPLPPEMEQMWNSVIVKGK